MNAVAKILTDAADLIDAKGWVQGVSRSPDGCYCLTGALHAANAPHKDWAIYDSARAAIQAETGKTWISGWNDDILRTQAEVTAMLRTVAAKQATA
jgi:hypothetical protein